MKMKKILFTTWLVGLSLLAVDGCGQGNTGEAGRKDEGSEIARGSLRAYGQAKEILRIWPATVSCQGGGVKRPPVVSADHGNNVKRLSEVTDPVLEVFPSDHPNGSGASVIICPGGGYNILAIDLEGYEIAAWLNRLGYTAFVLQYSVPQKKDCALQDLQRAVRLVKSGASAWKLDSAKVGILGFSAGAGLSARLSTRYEEHLYPAVDRADSLSARPYAVTLIYPAYLSDGPGQSLTPELHVSNQTPPTFLFATEDDWVGPSALVMALALQQVKAPFEVHVLPSGGHGYGLRKGTAAGESWPGYWEQWMKRGLR